MSSVWLNASALSNPHSLFVSLTSLLILGQDYLNKILFQALIDSGSTHCFVDSKFVDTHHLKTSTTSLVALCLFDGLLYTSSFIWKLHPHSDIISKLYKPTFYSGHLFRNMPYGSAVTIWVFHLLWQRYSYLTWSSMTELPLSVS